MSLKFWTKKVKCVPEELKISEVNNIPCDGNYCEQASPKPRKQPFQEVDPFDIIEQKNRLLDEKHHTICDLQNIINEWGECYQRQARYGFQDTKHIETLKLLCESRELEIYKLWECIETLKSIIAAMKKRRKK